MTNLELKKSHASFGGETRFYSHSSEVCNCSMNFSIFLPTLEQGKKYPVLYWLSGLTCTEENFIAKSGVQNYAAQEGIIVVAPDTSPRGCNIPGEEDTWSFGTGAGFYVDATVEKWQKHYNMYSYVTQELPTLIESNFPVSQVRCVSGHSMGGHGALVVALRNPDKYVSVSAFSPVCAPMNCPWGEVALEGYLGSNREEWQKYDASVLVSKVEKKIPLLVDQGTKDEFLEGQLKLDILQQQCQAVDYPLEVRIREGYDHSYYYIASFIGEHIKYHASKIVEIV